MNRKDTNSWLKHWDFILIDMILLQAAYIISASAPKGWQNPFENQVYINTALIIFLADICTAFFLEGYRGIMRRGFLQEFKAAFKHVFFVSAIEVFYLFLSKNADEFSRASYVIYVVMAMVLVYLGRIGWKQYLLKCNKNVFYQKRGIVIVTTSHKIHQVIPNVLKHTYNELEVIGVVVTDRDDMVGTKIEGVEVLCLMQDLTHYIQTKWVDGILICIRRGDPQPEELMANCLEMGISVHTAMAVAGEGDGNQKLDRMGGYIVLTTEINNASSRQLFLKRVMDIFGGIVGIIATGLITLFLAPAIFIASPGPIFFSQRRVGKNGRLFKIYKFRSMYMDAEERKKELMARNEMHGFMFKLDADPRIIGSGADGTKRGLGWFIRKTSLDEFPQFWNILKGDMSLVGTRPPTVDEWLQYEPHHRARMATKPGLTGMWQVSGRSDITDFEEVVQLDMKYIQNWSIGLDIKILFKTVMVVLLGRGSK